jgi:hypothetical protein
MIDARYLAGLFDGEGCIDLQRMYAKPPYDKTVYVRPRVRMCMSDNTYHIALLLQAEFGGYIGRRKSQNARQQSSWSLEWLSKEDIIYILDKMKPHLILKKEQAKLALWWLDNASGRGSQSGVPNIAQARQLMIDEMKALKQNPLRLAITSINNISACMNDKTVVSIR